MHPETTPETRPEKKYAQTRPEKMYSRFLLNDFSGFEKFLGVGAIS